jgi:hypothetical protein
VEAPVRHEDQRVVLPLPQPRRRAPQHLPRRQGLGLLWCCSLGVVWVCARSAGWGRERVCDRQWTQVMLETGLQITPKTHTHTHTHRHARTCGTLTCAKCPEARSASAAACTPDTNWIVPITHSRWPAVGVCACVCLCLYVDVGAFELLIKPAASPSHTHRAPAQPEHLPHVTPHPVGWPGGCRPGAARRWRSPRRRTGP